VDGEQGDAETEQVTGNEHATSGEKVTWAELGCPKAIGAYRLHGASIRVKNIHIIVAEDDPRAVFTVVAFRPPLGPPEYMLGHRIA
jgi:hypothetical protein